MRTIHFCSLAIILASLCGSLLSAQPAILPDPSWTSADEGRYSTGMIWRDCNNDGFIDVFFSNGNDIVLAPNTIYLSNQGSLPATPSWFSSNADYSGHCAVGDINDDSFPDFAVSNFIGDGGFSTQEHMNMYYNQGFVPTYHPDWTSQDAFYSFSCALGDPDGDGDLDLAFATGEGYTDVVQPDKIFFNNSGTLDRIPGWESTRQTRAMDVTWGDIDNDGDLDLALCYNFYPPAIHYNNNGVIESAVGWEAANVEPANTLILGDVNGDGWRDVVVAFNNQLGGSGRFRVYLNNGDGTIQTSPDWQSNTTGYGSGVSLYDYDNDGDQDLAAGQWWNELMIYENTGGTLTTTPIWTSNPSTVVEEIAWVDVDGNGVELFADTITDVSGKKVFYAKYHPLHQLDSVQVDGITMPIDQYCFDLVDGWVSLATEPSSHMAIYYQHSNICDIAISNWDTDNYVYPCTLNPAVQFSSTYTVDFAPTLVDFFDNTTGSSGHVWQFGDGSTSTNTDPQHEYMSGGAFDVTLGVDLPDRRHTRRQNKMIIVLADTVKIPDIEINPGEPITLTVDLTNAHPLTHFVIPILHSPSFYLAYDHLDAIDCRTEGLGTVTLVSASAQKATIEFIASSGKSLPPGYGPVFNIHFDPVTTPGTNIVDTTTLSSRSLIADAPYLTFVPAVEPGSITIRDYLCGDPSCDGTVNVGDAIYLVNWIFKGGAQPCVLDAADANCDGQQNIGDAVYLINYVFNGGPEPCCP